MFGERKINLRLTDRAKEWMENRKAQSGLRDPIVSVHWSRVRGEPEHKWMIGLYERADLREGWIGVAESFQFVVIQDWVFAQLDGKTIDITYDQDNHLSVSVTP